MSAMPATNDRIIRASTSRVEPKVFIKPDRTDLGDLGQVVQSLRALLRDAGNTSRTLAEENSKGQQLAHSLSPFLRQHSQLVEQHAQVLKLIDERAGEASAIYKLLAERVDKIDLFEAKYDERMNGMRDLLAAVDARLSGTQVSATRIEEQSAQALTRLRREFDAHMIQAADEANSRIESAGDRLESLQRSAKMASTKLYETLGDTIDGANASVTDLRTELDREIIGARACMLEAVNETHDTTDKLYADLERQKTKATDAAVAVEDALESSQEAARMLLGETQSRIDNTMRLGRLKLDELCHAFSAWVDSGQSSIDQAMKSSSAQMGILCDTIANETTQSIARLGAAKHASIKRIVSSSTDAAATIEDAKRAMGHVITSARSELSAFDTTMVARIDEAKQRIVGIVDQEAARADSLSAEVGKDLDDRLASLTGQCDRAQAILMGENGPDTTGLLVMLEKAESLERSVETADERAAFAMKQLEAIREQANQVRSALGRAVLLAADATDQADAKATKLNTALKQARDAAGVISEIGNHENQGSD